MQAERRAHRTPFTYAQFEPGQWVISAADGAPVAVVPGAEGYAAFICRACNRYDALLEIFDLCRGRHDNLTMPHTSPHDKAFDILSKKMDDEISKHGR